MLTNAFVLVNGILFSSWFNNSMFKSMFDELKEVKYLKEVTDFKNVIMENT